MKETSILGEAFLHIKRVEGALPNGVEVSRVVIRHKGAAVIIPVLDNGNFLLVKQYRLPIDKYLLEFPAGGNEEGEAWIETAKRELREETGFGSDNLKELGVIYPCPGFCDEIQYLYIAKDLKESPLKPDFDEDFELIELSKEQIVQKIKSGEITDAKTIAAFFRYSLLDN